MPFSLASAGVWDNMCAASWAGLWPSVFISDSSFLSVVPEQQLVHALACMCSCNLSLSSRYIDQSDSCDLLVCTKLHSGCFVVNLSPLQPICRYWHDKWLATILVGRLSNSTAVASLPFFTP
jgi:hypothetical protein